MKDLLQNTSGCSLWSIRDARIVLLARAVSALGDALTVTVLLLAVSRSREPFLVTALLISFAMPVVGLAGVAGRVVDGCDSRHVLVVSGSVQAIASALLAFGLDPAASEGLPILLGTVVLLQAAKAINSPTWAALMPEVVEQELVGKAVAAQMALSAVGAAAGAALGGVLYDLVGYRGAVLVDTATLLLLVVAAGMVHTRRGGTPRSCGIRTRIRSSRLGRVRRPRPRGAEVHPEPRKQPARTLSGATLIRRDAVLRSLVLALVVFVVAGEGVNAVEPQLFVNILGASGTTYGALGAVFSLGIVAGAYAAGRLDSQARRATIATVAAAGLGLTLSGFSLAPATGLLFFLSLVVGAANGMLNGTASALIITHTPPPQRGRVISALNGAVRAASIAALALGGILGTSIGARATFATLGLASLIAVPALLTARKVLAQQQAEQDQAPIRLAEPGRP